MRRRSRQGGSAIEFAICLPVLIMLLLGTFGIGISMLRQLQVVQLARDAGCMYARKVDFTDAGSQNILSRVAGSLGLTPGSGATGTAGAGSTVVILSTIQYVSASVCTSAGRAATVAACPNLGSWVFAERLVIGNTSLLTSSLCTPTASIVNTTTGAITPLNECTVAGDKVTGYNPWTSSTITNTNNALSTIQGQLIYVSEAASRGFQIPPYSSGTMLYSQLYF